MSTDAWTLDILKDINPSIVAEYLHGHGWHEQNRIADKASIWNKSANAEGDFEIILPLKPESPDFVHRILEVLETLKVTEQCSQSEILDALTSVSQAAMKMEREVINFALSLPNYYGSEAPISHLGTILCSLQDVVNGIGQSLAVQQGIAGTQESSAIAEELVSKRISSGIDEEMELSAFGSFKGSFGIKLVSSPEKLLGNTLISDSIEELVELVSIGSEIEGLREHLFKLRSKSARRYVNFLKSLTRARAGLRIDWGSPKPDYGGAAQMTFETAMDALRVIKELKTEQVRNISLVGRLTQGDVKTKHFKLEDDQGMEYAGYIADEAMPMSGILPLNQDCTVVIQETIVSFFITDKEDRLYKIIELSFSEDVRAGQGSLFT